MATEGSVYGNIFTENNIEIFYYEEPTYESLSSYGAPNNVERQIFAKTDFKWTKNDYEKFKKYANFTCRFTSQDGKKVVYTSAKMEHYPIGFSEDKPSHIKCKSPKWKTSEPSKLDFSVNG